MERRREGEGGGEGERTVAEGKFICRSVQDPLYRNKVVGQFTCLLSFTFFNSSGSGGSSLASILDGETSVNSSECVLISLYHPMALAAAAERLTSQGFLLFGML
jgi:hypothetical protein